MQTIDNLLTMDHCASCERELATTWNFCIYCGRPLVLASHGNPRSGHERNGECDAKPDDEPTPDPEALPEAIPAAIRVELEHPDEPPQRKYGGPFWVGMSMGLLGLVLIIYAVVQIYGPHA